MDIRPQRIVDLKDYGLEGQIVLEPLDFVRRKKMQNNIGGCVNMNAIEDDVLESNRVGDIMVYRVLAFIVSAPFRYDNIESFYNFMEKLDRRELGSADRLFNELHAKVKELSEESSSPLANSPTTSPQSSTE